MESRIDLVIGREYNYRLLSTGRVIRVRLIGPNLVPPFTQCQALESVKNNSIIKGEFYTILVDGLSEVELPYDPKQQADEDDDI